MDRTTFGTRRTTHGACRRSWPLGPFDNIFQPDGHKARVAINWGVAAALYAIAGSLIARALRR